MTVHKIAHRVIRSAGSDAAIGMVVGGLKPGRRWQSVLPRPADAFAGPAAGGGVQVGAALRF